MELSNVFLSSWVPQKELLANPKLKLFCTHGGANSMIESLYFGTPLLGFGQDADQFGGIHRMKRMGVARFGFPERSPEEIYGQIAEMLYDGDVAVNARD
jgi:glucuronosyltransferase